MYKLATTMELHQTPAEKLFQELADRKGLLERFYMDLHRGKKSQTIHLIVKQRENNTNHDHHKHDVNLRRNAGKKTKNST